MSIQRCLLAVALLLAGCITPPSPTVPILTPDALTATATPQPPPTRTLAPPASTTAAPASATPTTASGATPTQTVEPTGTEAPPTRTDEPATPTGEPSAQPNAPVILSFAASPAEIDPGGSVTLSWEAQADEIALWRLDAQGRLSELYPHVPAAGALTVNAPAEQRTPVYFMLFAVRGGVTVQASASVAVRCPDVWFFPNPPAACPQSPAHTTVMQAQTFEHGLMLWTAWNDFIYILYADALSPRWSAQPNAWFAGMPESDPALVPPAGLYQPVRGFGAAWRDEQSLPGYRVRDRLGWATAEEFGVPDAAFQCDSAPKYTTCFISGPGGVVYELKPERSGWEVWPGPK